VARGLNAQRTLLKDVAYDQLKELITTGAYAPGTFLSERQLAASLGMSKTPVRSAIERLESEGFLVVSPQQGILVAELSLDEIVDQFEIRGALEAYVVRRLAGRLSEEQFARLEENLSAQLRCAQDGDVLGYRQLDADFHLLLCECLGNQEIVRVMWRLRDKLHRVILRVIQPRPQRMLSSYEEHLGILEALKAGDGELAAARMEAHLEWGRGALVSR
jgi:DNA-binding GntR family transcriptional regulator